MLERIRQSSGGGEPHTRESLIYLFDCFSYLGLIKPQTNKIRYYLYSAAVNINCIIITPLAFSLGSLLNLHNLTMAQILTSMQATFDIYGIPAKIIAIAIYMRRLRSADQIMDELDARCTRPEEQEELRSVVLVGNRMIVTYNMVYGVYAFSTFVGAIIAGQTPYSLYNPFFDWRDSILNYCVQLVYEAYFIHMVVMDQAVTDSYAVIYIYILRVYHQILSVRLRRMGTDPEMSKEQNYEELVQCIKDHKNILRLLDTVSPVISITLFANFLCMVAVLCTTMVNILLFGDMSTRIASSLYVMAVILQTSPCCFMASYLIEDSEDIPVAIFQSNWIDQDPKYRKMLIFFQQSTQKPMELTALKIFSINLNTNLSIAKFTFSVYTLIKSMDIGQQT